jgi:AcrR family transcriptional regulator
MMNGMPKVTEEYREARRSQILDAARRCFVRNGFHETSMQDLFAESGLSAGAVYRYFPRKEDVILAIVEENMRDVVTLIHALASQPDEDGLGETVASVLDLLRKKNRDGALGSIALLVWAEAVRNKAVAKRFELLLRQMRSDLADAIASKQRAGSMTASVGSDGLAALILAIVPGFILQMTLLADKAVTAVPAAARAVLPA